MHLPAWSVYWFMAWNAPWIVIFAYSVTGQFSIFIDFCNIGVCRTSWLICVNNHSSSRMPRDDFQSVENMPHMNRSIIDDPSHMYTARLATTPRQACTQRSAIRMHNCMIPSVLNTSQFAVHSCSDWANLAKSFHEGVGSLLHITFERALVWSRLAKASETFDVLSIKILTQKIASRKKMPSRADHCQALCKKRTVSLVAELDCLSSEWQRINFLVCISSSYCKATRSRKERASSIWPSTPFQGMKGTVKWGEGHRPLDVHI